MATKKRACFAITPEAQMQIRELSAWEDRSMSAILEELIQSHHDQALLIRDANKAVSNAKPYVFADKFLPRP